MPKGHLSTARRLLELLEKAGYEARLAGGCVRDRQLGRVPHDFDIATTATPEQTEAVLKEARLRYFTTGRDHGTISAIIGGAVYEITTLRVDLKTDGRRAQVGFVSDWNEDASRRDFTVNALYEDKDGRIHDFVGGVADLSVGRLRFIGDAVARIREDYLRILRLFRFWARYSFFVEQETLQALQTELGGLSKLSHERITSEIRSFLACPKLGDALQGMIDTKVFQAIFAFSPEQTLVPCLETLQSSNEERLFLMRLFMIFWFKTKDLKHDFPFASLPLRLANEHVNALNTMRTTLLHCMENVRIDQGEFFLLENDLDHVLKHEHAFIDIIFPIGIMIAEELGDQVFQEKLRNLHKLEKEHGAVRRVEFPVSGNDLIESLGLEPGPILGSLLKELKLAFYRGKASSKVELLTLAERIRDERKSK